MRLLQLAGAEAQRRAAHEARHVERVRLGQLSNVLQAEARGLQSMEGGKRHV